jgi:hypothetical protein
MEEIETKGVALERSVRNTIVRITAREGETLDELYSKLTKICQSIEDTEAARDREKWTEEMRPEVEEAASKTENLFNLDATKRREMGLTDEYHMVILSLLLHFDECKGSAAIAEEWNINSGRVSRVFTASRKKHEKYKGHFEKCRKGGYHFTRNGLDHALEYGISAILGEESDAG